MNCKPGELAMIVSVGPKIEDLRYEVAKMAIGIPVRVVRLAPPNVSCSAALAWYFEEPIAVLYGGSTYHVTGAADDVMRPLRDQPGTDEMLLKVGKPERTLEVA